MRAVVCTGYGPPDVLQLADVVMPIPRANEVRVRVVATTAHAGDVRIRRFDVPRGQRLAARLVLGVRRPKHPILGIDVAGIVESVGTDVTRFAEGDEVLGFTGWRFGAYAEYLCLPERPRRSATKEGLLVGKPAGMSFSEAAAGLASGGMAALTVLRKADVRPGQQVLVYGASGSVGTYAVQLAKHLGATVTGVCGPAHLDLVRSLGADRVLDRTQTELVDDPTTYDVVVDCVGKLESGAAARRLRPGGISLDIVKDSGSGDLHVEDLLFLTRLAEQGRVRAVIDRRYPLEQIVEAHRYVELGHKGGHVVIDVGRPDSSAP